MTAIRLTGIPIEYVTAEMAAYPLSSSNALRLSVAELDPNLRDATRELWRAAERAIVRSCPGFSVDEGVAIRDKIWFAGETERSVSLHNYLRRIADDNLEVRGSHAVPRLFPRRWPWRPGDRDGSRPAFDDLRPREALARWRWRWLSFALPTDLLLAALPSREAMPTQVEVVEPAIFRQLYDKGFAETHLHLGAGLEFSLLWVQALHAIAQPSFRANAFLSPGADLNEGRDLAAWLIRAATARYVLAAFLARWKSELSFDKYLCKTVAERLEHIAGPANYSLLLSGLSDLLRGELGQKNPSDFALWQALYTQLSGAMPARFPQTLSEALIADPIAILMPGCSVQNGTAEMRFVHEALAYLDSREDTALLTDQRPKTFARLFWQVIRVRGLYYRHVTQRPMTPGLQWFVRFYERLKPVRRLASYDVRLAAAAAVCGQDSGLHSLEVRISPEPVATTVYRELKAFQRTANGFHGEGLNHLNEAMAVLPRSWDRWPQGHGLMRLSSARPEPFILGNDCCRGSGNCREFGVVFHFARDRGGHANEGAPAVNWRSSNADPEFFGDTLPGGGNPTGYRYAHYYNQKEREALTLIWILRNLPMTLEIVRGIDVCADELGVPVWVLAPLLRAVRRASEEASNTLHSALGVKVPPLHTTVHAGEDFMHLLTGLREVDEAIHFLELHEGGRIGHGLSLGVDAFEWARRAGRIAMPREVRMFDLAWEWFFYRRSRTPVPKGRRNLLEFEIARLSEKIFGRRCDCHDVIHLVEDLNDGKRLWEIGFPNGPPPRPRKKGTRRFEEREQADSRYLAEDDQGDWTERDRLLHAYLTSPSVFQRGQAVEWVEPAESGEVLAQIQAAIRANVAARGITIEVNPSSNLLIGDFGDMARHPLWRLHPPVGTTHEPPIPLCIGTDDPLTFDTNLPQEYQLIHDALVLAGLPCEEARRWLDNARERGMEARFTLPARSGAPLTYLRNPVRTPFSLLAS